MNPAVSLAVLIQNISKIGENIVLFFVMVAAQFAGGLLGLGFFIASVHGKSYLNDPKNLAQLKPAVNDGVADATKAMTVVASGAF
jgi:hypothetical protein